MTIRRRLRAAGTALAVMASATAVAAVMAGPAAATGVPTGIGGSSHAPAAAPLTPRAGATGSGAHCITPADVSPSGCVGLSNNPHISTHNPDTVNAEARTSCNNPVPDILAEGVLL